MDKSKKKVLIYRIIALVVLVLIAAAMFIIGRGHTVYFDNKPLEYGGKTIDEVPYKIDVLVNGEKVASIKEGERGMVDTMGQNFNMQLLVTKEKDGKTSKIQVGLPLPYNMDGIILNLPAMLAGLPQDAYISEFIPTPSAAELEDEEVVTDETEGLMDFGE
ncbi:MULTISPECIES: DUF6672 family protein [unclassified Butyrivibrio]|uniref:DUF6672 family protein n=1 Tax=unclassified Butyrivibrio TaxID=2639466 RepID=UPI0003B4BDCB|nr:MULTISPECIES: DUF6672 family protein [unclassified Butyrivibrio]SEK34858.1 hypothetical protein SAMN04487770_101232 [Butyrivibrio sp. ob235]